MGRTMGKVILFHKKEPEKEWFEYEMVPSDYHYLNKILEIHCSKLDGEKIMRDLAIYDYETVLNNYHEGLYNKGENDEQ